MRRRYNYEASRHYNIVVSYRSKWHDAQVTEFYSNWEAFFNAYEAINEDVDFGDVIVYNAVTDTELYC